MLGNFCRLQLKQWNDTFGHSVTNETAQKELQNHNVMENLIPFTLACSNLKC